MAHPQSCTPRQHSLRAGAAMPAITTRWRQETAGDAQIQTHSGPISLPLQVASATGPVPTQPHSRTRALVHGREDWWAEGWGRGFGRRDTLVEGSRNHFVHSHVGAGRVYQHYPGIRDVPSSGVGNTLPAVPVRVNLAPPGL